MHMLKLILCPVIIAVGGYIGFLLSKRYKDRVCELRTCELMLSKLKIYIQCENLRTSGIIARLAKSDSLQSLHFLVICNDKLVNNPDFPTVWVDSLNESIPKQALQNADYALLMRLSELIGGLDTSGICVGIDVMQQELATIETSANEQCTKTGGLCKRLGWLCGIALAIIVI